MAIQSEKDAIFEGALKELGKLRTANQAQLAQELSATMFAKLVSDMHADRDADGTPDILQRGRQVGPATVIPLGISTHDAPRQSKPDNGVTKPLGGGAGEGGGTDSANFQ
jgi:hypothetical protein